MDNLKIQVRVRSRTETDGAEMVVLDPVEIDPQLPPFSTGFLRVVTEKDHVDPKRFQRGAVFELELRRIQ